MYGGVCIETLIKNLDYFRETDARIFPVDSLYIVFSPSTVLD